ncbi:hypothetical protein B0T18DRAFT_417223 [Schizothecium vesticola]|uniref:Uncharacterized protein n=1 Tax=Schizothecium vesticola TaxID=314040 RepID=A0AA40BTI3_9PEZI|nr:hypothetical protein B0T18DRAFT_417223 [Schizothecium vesticola]
MTRSRHWAAAAWGSRGRPITSRKDCGVPGPGPVLAGTVPGSRAIGAGTPGPDTPLQQHSDSLLYR